MTPKPFLAPALLVSALALGACAFDPTLAKPRYATRIEDLPALQPEAPPSPPAAQADAPSSDPEPAEPQPAASASSAGSVSVATLPPPAAPTPLQPEPAPPPIVTPPAARPAPVSSAVKAQPRTHKVAPGDTLYGLARRYGTTAAVLKQLNALPEDGKVKVGQTLKLPPEAAPTPAAASGAGPVAVETPPTDVRYAVQAGDTLSGVARRFGLTLGEVQALNGLAPDAPLKAGQEIKLPNGAEDRGSETYARGPSPAGAVSVSPRPSPTSPPKPTVEAAPTPSKPPVVPADKPAPPPTPSQPTPAPTAPSRPAVPPASAPSTPPAPIPASPAVSPDDTARLGQGRFQWPVRGEVIGRFGGAGVGVRNDGIDIAANKGDPVRAAAAGEVAYAGNSVPGFGNLVLIKHADGWVTAYAYLDKITVKMREQVAQGGQVGTVGTSGSVAEPALHFEVRYAPSRQDRAKPLDPLSVLPPR